MKMKILFLLYKSKINKTTKCPIRCRITYKDLRKEFTTGLSIFPSFWVSKSQIAKPPNDENDFINNQLGLIKSKINKVFLWFQVQENSFTVNDIYSYIKG